MCERVSCTSPGRPTTRRFFNSACPLSESEEVREASVAARDSAYAFNFDEPTRPADAPMYDDERDRARAQGGRQHPSAFSVARIAQIDDRLL